MQPRTAATGDGDSRKMTEGSEPGRTGGDTPGIVDRLRQGGGGRSSFVYIVVGVVAITLALLLVIIYFSASERERTSPPICTAITLEEAQEAVLRGEVERLTVVYDDADPPPTSERYGPVLAKLDFTDETCSNLPQGVANQDIVYTIAGVIAFYNENTEGQTVDILWQETANLDEELFELPTEIPTEMPEPTATVAPPDDAVAPAVIAEPDETPEPIEVATPAVVTGTPVASPAFTPDKTVIATP